VATAVKEAVGVAVKEAVQAVLTEILTNPELQKRLAATQAANVPTPAPTLALVGGKARSCWGWLTNTAKETWANAAFPEPLQWPSA
jgi:hypothetical protein